MTKRRLIFSVLAIGLLVYPALACTNDQASRATPVQTAVVFPHPITTVTLRPETVTMTTATSSPILPMPTVTVTRPVPATATFSHAPPTATVTVPISARATVTSSTVPPTLTVTAPTSGPALVEAQFALDVEQNGQPVFPATEFVFGVTRVYVRFVYQGLGDAENVESVWYQNENPVSTGNLTWDGGDAGTYIIWIEDPNGLGRGEWRWELVVGDAVLEGGAFIVGGAPRHVNEDWGLSFDPPTSWTIESENPNYVTFSSPDQGRGIALRYIPQAIELSESAAAELALFLEDHPAAEVVAEEEATMYGEAAVLQHVRYPDQERGEQVLFIATALHAGSTYSLWVLGPSDDVSTLKTLLTSTLRSIRFFDKKPNS